MTMHMMGTVFVLIIVAIVSYTDYKQRLIPNVIILPSIVVMFIYNLLNKHYYAIFIATVIAGLFFAFYMFNYHIIGGGDIKLIYFVGLYAGSSIGVVLSNAMFAFLIIWLFMIVVIAKKTMQTQGKRLIDALKITCKKRVAVPLAPAMFVSLVLFVMKVGG